MEGVLRMNHRSVWLMMWNSLLAWLFLISPVLADNHDVMDDAGVLNRQTEQYIYDVNQNQMAKIKGHPQIAVITKKSIDNSIEDEAQQLFNKYEIGTKGYDNGVLLLIDVGGHHVRMQTGYGIESAVPDDFVNQLMTSKVQADFRSDNYSAGTKKMVQKLAKRIIDHQSELRSKSAVNKHQASVEAAEQQADKQRRKFEMIFNWTCWILISFTVVGFLIQWFVLLGRRYQRAKLVEKQFNDLKVSLKGQWSSEAKLDWDAIKLPSEDEQWLIRQLRDDKLSEDNLRPALCQMINVLVLNQLVQQNNPDWSLLADDGSIAMSMGVQALFKVVGLQNFKQNYDLLASRLVNYLSFANGLDDQIEKYDVKSLEPRLLDRFRYVISMNRVAWPDLAQSSLDEETEKLMDEFHDDGKDQLVNLANDRDDLSRLLENYVQGYMIDTQTWINHVFNRYADQQARLLISALDQRQQQVHKLVVDEEFERMLNRPHVKELIDDDELQYVDQLTLYEKEKALEEKDDQAAFRSVVVGYLAGYLSASHSSSSWYDDDDDDDNWFDGSSGFGGGGFDGGSFGGGGGFSGGGGGTASW